jgi:hypothetical protein
VFDPVKTGIDAIDTNRRVGKLNAQVGNLDLHGANTLHHFELPIVNRVNPLADGPQMLQNQAFRFIHICILAQFRCFRDPQAASSWNSA